MLNCKHGAMFGCSLNGPLEIIGFYFSISERIENIVLMKQMHFLILYLFTHPYSYSSNNTMTSNKRLASSLAIVIKPVLNMLSLLRFATRVNKIKIV